MLDLSSYSTIYKLTSILSCKKSVILALYCTETFNVRDKESQFCIDLIQKWLDNPESVTQKQLEKAIDSTWLKWTCSIPTARAAWNAIFTAFYGNSINNNVFNSQQYAYSACITSYNFNIDANLKIPPYFDALLNTKIPKTPYTDPLEIIIYLQDQLEYPILDRNRLNLWSRDYEYQITGSIESIAQATGVKYLIRGCTNA